ncbi:Integrase catalytic region (plasmid) [Emticicia oligotrophica DSM 17448]|uniref:Integrase catalytic region n=1 Tax=Emticicia oligotrophica (strain DSM 17448 / CIP 109782 / MTCC 6937 / GPTSA100-15) TaxID=929562 RepID=A0ABM5N7N0_EMTOG|nr:DDE-type integrase/transposase/recombinase [Emticicia oligotrophica]AFK05534.1 Integrase catalytic region [Emticicia oligotrophica DSM 17448]
MKKSELLNEDFIQYQELLYVRDTYLIDVCKISSQKIAGIIAAFQTKKTIYGKHIKSGENIWFEYDHLPSKIRESKLLPSKPALIENLKNNKFDYEKENNPLYQREMILLNIAVDNSEMFIAAFKEYKIPKNKISPYCKTYAVLKLLTQFEHLKIHEKYNLHNAISDSGFSFQSNNIDYFYAKYADVLEFGLVRSITHKGVSNKNANKVTKTHEDLVGHFYRNGNKLSRRDILQKVNTALKLKNLQPISLTTVKRILLNTYNKNIDGMVRNGETWTKNTILPFLIRSEPENSGDHYQIDATKLQICCKDGNQEGAFLWIAVVIDGYSRQVMGFAIADKETPDLYAKALKSAFSRANFLPAEILRDNYLGYTRNNDLSDLIQQTENLGVIWRAHKVGNPRDKGIVESFNNIFNTVFCKQIPGYIGEGIKSKNINARPNPDILTFMKKNKLLPNTDEVILRVTANIHKYNLNGTQNDKISPLEKFQLKPPKNTIVLNSEADALLYFKKKTVKVSRSTICVNVNDCSHFYRLSDADLILELHNTMIQVRYDPHNMLLIYLFTELESKFITRLAEVPIIPLAQINQTIDDQSNLKAYFQQNKQLLKNLQQKIEERQSAIDALELPPEVLESGFSGDLEVYKLKKEEKFDIDYGNPIQLPKDKKLKTDKIFTKYRTVYNEIQDLLYKQKGTVKRL